MDLILVVPPTAPSGGTPCLLLMAAAGTAALGWAVATARRERDALAILACVGAMIAVLNEPIYDLLGQIIYASNHPTAFTAFDRQIPLFLLFGYVPFVGALPAYLAVLVRRGVRATQLRTFAFLSFVAVVVIETIGTSTHNWQYYGRPPLKYLGVAPQMAPVPIVCAWLLWMLSDRLRGWSRLWLVAVPPVSLAAVYAGAGFPMYVALNSNVPAVVDWLAGAATLALCAGIVWWVTDIVGSADVDQPVLQSAHA